MERIPALILELQKYEGSKLLESTLRGRGYFLIKDFCEEENGFEYTKIPQIKEFEQTREKCIKDFLAGMETVTSENIKEMIAHTISPNEEEGEYFWIKELPTKIEDVQYDEIYMYIILRTSFTGNSYVINQVYVFTRTEVFNDNKYTTGKNMDSLFSNFHIMKLVPPEVVRELENLCVLNRCVKNNFSFVGKPIPSVKVNELTVRGDNAVFEFASGYRYAYTAFMFELENNIIKKIKTETLNRDWRISYPESKIEDDYGELFDGTVEFCDLYSKEEWDKIV